MRTVGWTFSMNRNANSTADIPATIAGFPEANKGVIQESREYYSNRFGRK
jgi:hypothetical protein